MQPPAVATHAQLDAACAVGTITHNAATLWVRFTKPEVPLTLTLSAPGDQHQAPFFASGSDDTDQTFVITYPDDFPGKPSLRPNTKYSFTIEAEGQPIGAGSFMTFPAGHDDTPERFSFAFSSCHQPFDKEGKTAGESLAMIEATTRALAEHDVKFLLLCGDQVYADEPACFSLHGDSPREESPLLSLPREEIRKRYHQQYRRSWATPGFLALQSQRSTHCMIDDHEIVDNWGSNPAHAGEAWQRVAAAALDAFFDYQRARNHPRGTKRPAHLHRSFSYGTIAVFLADVRSERSATPGAERVMSEGQVEALAAFLRDNADKHALFVAIGVPPVHIPTWFNRVGDKILAPGSDLHDRWSNPALVPERDRLLGLLAEHRKAHPQQGLAILSGDIHAGWAASLKPPEAPPFHQFIASALTNNSGSMTGILARVLLGVSQPLHGEVAGLSVDDVPGQPGGKNPYGGLNLGIVEVERRSRDHSSIRFRLIGQHDERPSEPVVVFDSGPLGS